MRNHDHAENAKEGLIRKWLLNDSRILTLILKEMDNIGQTEKKLETDPNHLSAKSNQNKPSTR